MRSSYCAILVILCLGFAGCAATGLERTSENGDRPGFWHQTFGEPSGFDPVARDIERRLGVGTER